MPLMPIPPMPTKCTRLVRPSITTESPSRTPWPRSCGACELEDAVHDQVSRLRTRHGPGRGRNALTGNCVPRQSNDVRGQPVATEIALLDHPRRSDADERERV